MPFSFLSFMDGESLSNKFPALGLILDNLRSAYPFLNCAIPFNTFSPLNKLTLLLPRKEILLILKFCFFRTGEYNISSFFTEVDGFS